MTAARLSLARAGRVVGQKFLMPRRTSGRATGTDLVLCEDFASHSHVC